MAFRPIQFFSLKICLLVKKFCPIGVTFKLERMNIFSHIGSSLYCPIQNKHKKYRLLATKKEDETILYQSPNLLQPYHQTSFTSSWSCREVWSYEMWHVPGDMWHTILDAWHDWNIFLFFLLNRPIEFWFFVCLSVHVWQFKTPPCGCPGDFRSKGILVILGYDDKYF